MKLSYILSNLSINILYKYAMESHHTKFQPSRLETRRERAILSIGVHLAPPGDLSLIRYPVSDRVNWGDAKSSEFRISNGTRQGAVLSPLFWSVYMDPLLKRLRDLGLGAHILNLFMGAVCYADDVLLIAPTRSALQRMLWELEVFAGEFNIEFRTNPVPSKSKTKCIFIVGNKKTLPKPAPLMLCGTELPFVKQAEHLGNILTEDGTMEHDASVKRAKFINSSVEIREMFNFAAPEEIVRSLRLYSNSFYGSNLWDLNGANANQVYCAWNNAVKLAWGLPQYRRTYILQRILSCGFMSARTEIFGRFVKFFHELRN